MEAVDRLIKSDILWPGFFGRYMNALDTCTFLVKSKYDRAPELNGLGFPMIERAMKFGGVQKPSGKSSYHELVACLKQNMPPLKKAIFACKYAVDDHTYIREFPGGIFGPGSVVKIRTKAAVAIDIVTDIITYTEEAAGGEVRRVLAYRVHGASD